MKSSKENDSIIFFPEATFLREEGLLKFKKGAFLTAIRNQVPVVPVTINGSRTLLRSESWLPENVQLKVTIHPPISTDRPEIEIKEIMEEARERVLSNLGEPDLNTKSFQ
jgi:1-acyl-sn-glycerol-3-phosphate acyltransferase